MASTRRPGGKLAVGDVVWVCMTWRKVGGWAKLVWLQQGVKRWRWANSHSPLHVVEGVLVNAVIKSVLHRRTIPLVDDNGLVFQVKPDG